jgi:hypothetical protein
MYLDKKMVLTVRMAENVSDTQSDICAWTIPYDLKVGTVDLLKIAG